MKHNSALACCLLVAGAAGLLNASSRDSRPKVPAVIAAGMSPVRPAVVAAGPAPAPIPAATQAALPEPAGPVCAPGEPIPASTETISAGAGLLE